MNIENLPLGRSGYNQFKLNKKLVKHRDSITASSVSNKSNYAHVNFSYIFKHNTNQEFENIRQLRRDKSLLKSNLSNAKNFKIKILSNIHKDTMRESLMKSKNQSLFFLTKAGEFKKENNENEENEEIYEKFLDSPINSPVKKYNEEKIVPKPLITLNLPPAINRKNITSSTNFLNQNFKERESSSGFMKKIKVIRVGNLRKEVQRERLKREEEIYVNKIEGINDKMENMKHTGEILHKFNNTFSKYIKKLSYEHDFEKTEGEKLLREKGKHDLELTKLRTKIYYSQKELNGLSDIRNFLICVREKRISLPKVFFYVLEEINNENDTIDLMINEPNLNKNKEKIIELRRKAGNYQLSDFQLTEEEKVELERLISYIKSNEIFSSPKDFINFMNYLEKDNLKLAQTYDKLNCVITKMTNEINKMKTESNFQTDNFLHELAIKEEEFREIKTKHKILKQEKDNLLGSIKNHQVLANNNFRFKSSDVSPNLDKIFLKASEIVKNMASSIKNLNFPQYKTYMNGPITNEKHLIMLRDIEKGIDFLLNKYKEYKFKEDSESTKYKFIKGDRPVINLSYVENNLDKERKRNKAIEKKIKDQIKREELKIKVNERLNKIYIRPKRRVDFRYKPKDGNGRRKSEEFNTEAQFEEMISYEETHFV